MLEVAPGAFALPERALWLPEPGVLAVGDLHVGYEAAFTAGGAAIPATGTRHVVETLERLCLELRPREVVVNGDFKHGFRYNPHEARDVARVAEAVLRHAPLVVVKGNHDAGIEAMLPPEARVVDAHQRGPAFFTHGHRKDRPPRGMRLLVVSHEHPALVVRDEVGAGVKFPAFLVAPDGGAVVLPALSPWARGVDVLAADAFAGAALRGRDPGTFTVAAATEAGVLRFGAVGALRALRR